MSIPLEGETPGCNCRSVGLTDGTRHGLACPYGKAQLARFELTLDELVSVEDMPEWVVFERKVEGHKIVLQEIAQVRAMDADRALILVAEDNPQTADKALVAVEARMTKGKTVRLRYLASLTDH